MLVSTDGRFSTLTGHRTLRKPDVQRFAHDLLPEWGFVTQSAIEA